MQVEVKAVAPEQVEADVVAVPLAGDDELAGAAAALDSKLDGLLGAPRGRRRAEGRGRPRLDRARGRQARRARESPSPGSARRERIDADALRTAAAAVARASAGFAETLAWAIDDSLALPADEQARALVEGTCLGGYDPGALEARRAERPQARPRSSSAATGDGLARRPQRAATVAEWTNRARDLVNAPPNETDPGAARRARGGDRRRRSSTLTAEALGPDEIARARHGRASPRVGQGSDNPPRLIVMRYEPPSRRAATSCSASSARRSPSTPAASRSSRRCTWRT